MKVVEIKSIKKIENKSKRYDIKTGTSNFFANNILVHNCSSTYFSYDSRSLGIKQKKFGVCSRNIWLKTKSNSNYWQIAEQYNIKDICLKYKNTNIVIQGEIIGNKIQKNKYKIDGLDYYVFNVFKNGVQLTLNAMIEFCKENNLKTVPVVAMWFNPLKEIGPGKDIVDVVKYLVEMSQGNTVLLASDGSKLNQKREGIVMRLVDNPRVSFKAINPQFLLENDE